MINYLYKLVDAYHYILAFVLSHKKYFYIIIEMQRILVTESYNKHNENTISK